MDGTRCSPASRSATAWLLKGYAGTEISFLARFIIAALFIAAGRLALIFGPWPIGPH
jgi:hypothetical protein